jgi:hypothetical protein
MTNRLFRGGWSAAAEDERTIVIAVASSWWRISHQFYKTATGLYLLLIFAGVPTPRVPWDRWAG